ncbi:MAG: prepilin-type N-terminal cleavage/methylation domain-containing protein [Candidatus Riflebacteria bacterium]|nr:prepilin-type N-terminal cleavage/methylation domain-containing protein [Candidatus Riflebacteria bacterium]
MSRSCKAESSENAATPGSDLHKRSLSRRSRGNVSGFTLIEVLIVVLIIGVLFGTGLSVYSGVIRDSQLRTRTDELTSFFAACRHRAIMRKSPITIMFSNGNLGTDQAHNLRQRIPEIDTTTGARLLNALRVEKDGKFTQNGKSVERLHLPIKMPGGQTSVITVEL